MSTEPDFCINGRFLAQTMTGVQRYAYNIVAAMDAQITAYRGAAGIAIPDGAAAVALKNIEVVETSSLVSGHLWEQMVLPAKARGMLLNLCNLAPVVKKNQIVCIHDANVFTAADSYSRSFQTVYRLLQPHIARRSARVATVSNAAARQIARHLQIEEADIAVLSNGHEHALAWRPDLATVAPTFLKQRYGDSARQFVLVLGSRSRHKNLDLVTSISPELDRMGIDIVVVGGGSAIFNTGKTAQHSNMILLDRLSDDDLAALLDRALCLLFPSFAEGFGLPIIEAMARGCPVVSSYSASMPEVCGEAALLASPFDPQAWVSQIRRLADEPQLREELIERSHEQVKQFSWASSAKGYLDLVDQPARTMSRRAEPAAALSASVVIATRGRPDVVSATVRHLLNTQTVKPHKLIVSCVDPVDAGDLIDVDGVEIIIGPGGLAAQRNSGLAALPADSDIIVFFDDDFVAEPDWLKQAVQIFQDESSVVGFTGGVLADGIKGPGIDIADAIRTIETRTSGKPQWIEPYSPYGCNMAFRLSAVGDIRFDEKLVLYGWLEDRDFAAAITRTGGRLVKSSCALGVHMGTKSGRVNGVRLGYSQVVNPIYMWRKGTMSWRKVADHIVCNMAINIARSPSPERFIDRRGRLKGNLRGLADLLRGRLEPERAATLVVASPITHSLPVESIR